MTSRRCSVVKLQGDSQRFTCWRRLAAGALATLGVWGAAGAALAQDAGATEVTEITASQSVTVITIVWWIAFIGSLTALIQAFLFYKSMMAADEGNERMVEIAGYVRQGANAYLKQVFCL